ncbi:MAG: hypothetical protein J6386_15575 [Candidatus Synoicihabitans palmerolidicus]|nr:hypothetical protein [Candidatus Synoicihabitans palmerolidicus]
MTWERDNFRTTGAQAGADLMMKWNFPEALVRAVRHAAAPVETRLKHRGACVLHLAAKMAADNGYGLRGESDEWEDSAEMKSVVGLNDQLLRRAKDETTENFARWRSLME